MFLVSRSSSSSKKIASAASASTVGRRLFASSKGGKGGGGGKKVVLVDGVRLPFAMSSTIYNNYMGVDLQKLAFKVGVG